MPKVEKELQYTLLNGILVPVPQHIDASGNFVATGESNPLPTKDMGSDYQKPVEIQSGAQDTIQTQNAALVPANSGSNTSTNWEDLNGVTEIGVTVQNDSNSAQFFAVVLWSNDKVNVHGATTALANGAAVWSSSRGGTVRTAGRFAKVVVVNSDTAAAHTMSAWIYKKAI